MINFLKKNKFYVAGIVLFVLLYFYGNNIELYNNEENTESLPENINKPQELYLDPTDDVVLNRKDLVQLEEEKIGKFSYDGWDNWDRKKGGWWSEHIQAGDIYPSPSRMVWPD